MQGSELSRKIEEIVRRSVTSVVEDINGTLNDVREAVNQQFEAAVQSVMADAQATSITDELEAVLSGADAGGAVDVAPPPPSTASAQTGTRDLKRAIQEVERGASQVEVLNAMLEKAIEFSSRAALLVLKGDAFSGWKGKGFSESGGDDEVIKRITLEPGSVSELDKLRQNEQGVAWDGSSFATRTSITPPTRAILIPMVIKDKVAATLYADQIEEGTALDRASLELLVFTTGLLVDTLAIRKKIPSPTLSPEAADDDPFEDSAQPELSIGEPSAPAEPAPEPETPSSPEVVTQVAPPGGFGEPSVPSEQAPPQAPPAVDVPGPAETTPPPVEPPAPAPPKSPAPSTQVTPPADPSTQVEPPSPPAEPPSPPVKPPSTEVKPPSAPAESSQEESTQYVPPPDLQKEAPGIGTPAAGDTRQHDDAKRFARLLVSEIKLYNEGKVDQGRKNRDLYERLKEDIDRSRQMYEERVSDDVRSVTNYFYDELVRILADGDADALGL